MNTKQKTNNQYAGKNGKLISLFSLLVLFTLAFIGCNDPLTVTDNNLSAIPAGKGSFSLRLSDAARTILPVTPSLNSFAVYNMSFTPVNGGSAVNTDRTNQDLGTNPILLEPGTYNLVVNAYKDSVKNQLAARGTSNGITITAGQNTSAAVTLEALLSGGTGTFRWNITLPSGVTASMTITPVNTGGTAGQTVNLTSETAGSRTLNSGQYSVTFNLTKTDGKTVVWNELLYVYQNLESAFTFGFTDAHFSDTRYTVTFNDGTSNQTQPVLHGNVLTSYTPSRSGYIFGGWYTDNNTFANLYDFNSPVTGSFILYAKWTAAYTITFNINGGTGTTPATQTITVGASLTLPAGNGFSRSGYTFGGWNTDASGTGTNYSAGASYTPAGNITLYAKWTAVYTITFNINGGTGTTPAAQTITAGASLTLPTGNGFSRSSYTFGGWNTDASGTGTNYSAGASYTPAGNITLYAKWNTPAYSDYVKEVTFTGGSTTATVTFPNLNGNDIYLVKVNTSDSVVSAADTGNAQAPFSNLQDIGKSPLPSGKELPRMGHPAADEFNANPPPIVQEAPRKQRALFAPPVVNDTRYFWVETYYHSDTWVQKQATLRATGQYGNIWVMNENLDSGTSANKIMSAQAQTLAQKFDQIYPVETKLIGYEYGGGPGGDGGKDGDPKVQILVYDIVNASGDVMAAGFFWNKDFYNDSQLSTQRSNLAEIFYIDASQLKDVPVYIHSTLIHEFQHMIHFNRKYVEHRDPYTNQGLTSAAWYNEMLSMMAEDVIAPLIGIPPTNSSHEIRTRMPTALTNYYLEGITEWGTLSSTSYATKFAFGAYLMRNYGGAELLQRILANNTTNIDSITSALNEFESGLTFEKALRRYGEAMIFSGPSMPQGVMTFHKTVTQTISGTEYIAYGFDIWNDFGTTKGPYVLGLNQTNMRPYSITIHSTNGWKNKTGSFSITLNRPSDQNVVLYLMVK
jgi:uncharacterized repeat protein (TIGR02543 family)